MVDEHGLQVRVSVAFAGLVMFITWVHGCKLLKPALDVFNQTVLIVVHVSSRDVHCRDQCKPLLDAALPHGLFNLRSNVNILMLMAGVECQVFGMRFHAEKCNPEMEIQRTSVTGIIPGNE